METNAKQKKLLLAIFRTGALGCVVMGATRTVARELIELGLVTYPGEIAAVYDNTPATLWDCSKLQLTFEGRTIARQLYEAALDRRANRGRW